MTPYLLRYTCQSTQGSLCPSPMKIHYWPFFKNFSQKVNNLKWPLDDLWPHICWCLMCDSTQGSLCLTPMVIHQSMWIQWLFFKSLIKRMMTPRWFLTLLLLRSHMWLYQRVIVSKSHENTSEYVDKVTIFQKTLTNRSMTQMTPRWPLTPLLLRSQVWLYPRIICPTPIKNTSKHLDTVTHLSKTLTKGQWPLDDLWPHFWWSHMCVTLPKDHSVQVPWEYINVCKYSDHFCKTLTKIPHTTYLLHAEWVVSFWTKFRREKNKGWSPFNHIWIWFAHEISHSPR